MLVKPGVQLSGVHYLLWYAAAVWDYILASNSLAEGMITGGREGADLVGAPRLGREHAAGLGVDFRRPDWPAFNQPGRIRELVELFRRLVGPDFQIIVERDHIHVDLFPAGTLRA